MNTQNLEFNAGDIVTFKGQSVKWWVRGFRENGDIVLHRTVSWEKYHTMKSIYKDANPSRLQMVKAAA